MCGTQLVDSGQVRCIHPDRIAEARRGALAAKETETLASLFKAMGEPNRLRILWALTGGEMCVCDLAGLLEASESAVSHQLRLLRQLALVRNRRQGQVLYYRLGDDHDPTDKPAALARAMEFGERIPIGVLWKSERPAFGPMPPSPLALQEPDRAVLADILAGYA